MVDVSEWSPTTHCKQMRRERGISWDTVADCVRATDTEGDGENGCVIRSTWSHDHLVRAVLDPDEKLIVSVFRWCDKDDNPPCTALTPAEHSQWLPER